MKEEGEESLVPSSSILDASGGAGLSPPLVPPPPQPPPNTRRAVGNGGGRGTMGPDPALAHLPCVVEGFLFPSLIMEGGENSPPLAGIPNLGAAQ